MKSYKIKKEMKICVPLNSFPKMEKKFLLELKTKKIIFFYKIISKNEKNKVKNG